MYEYRGFFMRLNSIADYLKEVFIMITKINDPSLVGDFEQTGLELDRRFYLEV